MDDAEFLNAVAFIKTDVERELQLARLNGRGELGTVLHSGGGNLLAALGLLCYTEFGGKILFGHKKKNGDDHSKKNFDDFFRMLGPKYAALLGVCNVYNVFRCGLAHEYAVKEPCSIAMFSDQPDGIGVGPTGIHFIVVQSYFRALLAALQSVPRLRRIRYRAYFLWENRTGRCWWDAESNWLEAESAEPAG
jgi:hypothetical protein